jgi:hypothetical protein
MRIKYIPFFTEHMEEQVRLFTEELNFNVVGKRNMYENTESKLLHSGSGDTLIALTNHKAYRGHKNCMILNTDDCLKDYHQLKAGGLLCTKESHYLPIGLVAEFIDLQNNRYVLLEERNYNNDL